MCVVLRLDMTSLCRNDWEKGKTWRSACVSLEEKKRSGRRGTNVMQMSFISRVGHAVVTPAIFKTGHLINPTPRRRLNDTEAALTSGCCTISRRCQIKRQCLICIFKRTGGMATATQWYMYVCKSTQVVRRRPGPNLSGAASGETSRRHYLTPAQSPVRPPPSVHIHSLLHIQQEQHQCIRARGLWSRREAVKKGHPPTPMTDVALNKCDKDWTKEIPIFL